MFVLLMTVATVLNKYPPIKLTKLVNYTYLMCKGLFYFAKTKLNSPFNFQEYKP